MINIQIFQIDEPAKTKGRQFIVDYKMCIGGLIQQELCTDRAEVLKLLEKIVPVHKSLSKRQPPK